MSESIDTNKSVRTLVVDYDMALRNHVRSDAQKAIQIFISGEVGTSLTIFPQALNPFLKAVEGLGIWKSVVVLPTSDSNGKPLYIVVKIDDTRSVSEIVI